MAIKLLKWEFWPLYSYHLLNKLVLKLHHFDPIIFWKFSAIALKFCSVVPSWTMVQNQLIRIESRFRPHDLKFCSVDLMRSEGLGPDDNNNKKNVPELGVLTANLTWLGRPCSWTLSTKLVANRHLADVYFSTPPLRLLLSFTLTKGAIAVCLARRPIFIVCSRLTWISILLCCSYASWTSERCCEH